MSQNFVTSISGDAGWQDGFRQGTDLPQDSRWGLHYRPLCLRRRLRQLEYQAR